MKTQAKVMLIALLLLIPINFIAQPFEGEKGDVNNDGDINVIDIIITANHILEIDILDEQGLWRADLNGPIGNCDGDGSVNILDAVKIVNIILSLDACSELTDIDGNVYETVTIGDQVWMAENLKVTHYRNGDAIPNVTSNSEWENLTSGAYSNYDNDTDNVPTYGRLYNWYAVNDSRGIAPEGWHVPSDEEWKQLEMHLGMSQSEADDTGWRGTDEGGKLKATGTIAEGDGLWYSPNTGATNESGFSALPGGYRESDYGTFDGLSIYAVFWASTEYSSLGAWTRYLSCNYAQGYRDYSGQGNGFSVRCVKD